MPGTMADTHLVIFAHAALHREAWRALLSGQPGIRLAGAAGDLAAVTSFLPAGQPGAVLVDQSPPRPDLVRRLKAAVSDFGLLLLVNTYDLGEVIPLLQAGATGGRVGAGPWRSRSPTAKPKSCSCWRRGSPTKTWPRRWY